MTKRTESKGLLYWKPLEMKILLDNLDKTPKELAMMLPGRTEGAIYAKLRYHTSHKNWKGKIYSLRDLKLRKMTSGKSSVVPIELPTDSKEIELQIGNINIKIRS